MAGDFSLSVAWINLDSIRAELEAVVLGLDVWKRTHAVLEGYVEDAFSTYVDYLNGAAIPGHGALKNPSGRLAKDAYHDRRALLTWTIGNSADYAKAVEDGAPAFDMKQNLPTAPRARRAKDGHLYLIIPFRHGVVGTSRLKAMPRSVYALAKVMAHSRSLGSPSTRLSGTGWTVPKFNYQWQGRVSKKALVGAGLGDDSVRRYQGMVRMGGTGQTTYLTFRVMSEKSKPGSWVRPATPAMAPLQTALEVAWTKARPDLERALEADLREALGG
jgi:hypothetical protein